MHHQQIFVINIVLIVSKKHADNAFRRASIRSTLHRNATIYTTNIIVLSYVLATIQICVEFILDDKEDVYSSSLCTSWDVTRARARDAGCTRGRPSPIPSRAIINFTTFPMAVLSGTLSLRRRTDVAKHWFIFYK